MQRQHKNGENTKTTCEYKSEDQVMLPQTKGYVGEGLIGSAS